MKLYSKILLLMAMILVVASCEDEDRFPLVVLDTVEKGAYPRLIDESDKLLNLFDIEGSSYTYNVEFVDEVGGSLTSEYAVDLVYDDNNPDNGDDSSGPNQVLSIPSSEFSMGPNGFLVAPTITITGSQALAAAGVSADQVKAGDNFNFVGRITLSDGRTFSQSNSSSTVVGPAFRGHFNFTMPAACPSSLEGSYSYESTDAWCDGTSSSGEVEIVADGAGVYHFSDWSFGAYTPCYGAIANQPGIKFEDVCAEVAFTAVVDSYGDTWTFVSSVEGEQWSIDWNNTYGESGKTVITKPGGWGFTLK